MSELTPLQLSLEPGQMNRDFPAICEWFNRGGLNLQGEILERLMAHPSGDEPFRMADFGCGTGDGIESAARLIGQSAKGLGVTRPIEAIGIDENPTGEISDKVLSWGEGFSKTPVAKLISAKVDDSTLEDNSVDVLFSKDTLIYVADTLKAFNEGYRVLKPGGVAVWDVPESNISAGPNFKQIIEMTPGAGDVFQYVPVDDVRGFVVCRKSENDSFKGFPFEVFKEVGYIDDSEVVKERARHFKTAIYRALSN